MSVQLNISKNKNKNYVIDIFVSHSKKKGDGRAILCDEFKNTKYKNDDVVILTAVGGTGNRALQKIHNITFNQVKNYIQTNNFKKFLTFFGVTNFNSNKISNEELFEIKKILTTGQLVKYYQSLGKFQ